MEKGRILHSEVIKDHSLVGVYGIFDTVSVKWKYYVISYTLQGNLVKISSEICGFMKDARFESIKNSGKKVDTLEEGVAL